MSDELKEEKMKKGLITTTRRDAWVVLWETRITTFGFSTSRLKTTL